jgi:hypothetical protein
MAFGTVASVAFLLWPMTVKGRDFPLWRLVVFGALVFSLGAFLFFSIFLIPVYSYQPHISILTQLMQILELSIAAVVVLGILAIPAATGIARLAVILGNPRLEPK